MTGACSACGTVIGSSILADVIDADVFEVLTLEGSVAARDHIGGTAPRQVRAAIARALANDPPLIVADEPTGNLDEDSGQAVISLLTGLARDQGTTMLIVTHQMHFARQIADRVLFTDHGVILEQGTPGEVLESPREERTRVASLSKSSMRVRSCSIR